MENFNYYLCRQLKGDGMEINMNNFIWYNPTKIIFGKNSHLQVGETTAQYGKKILLHYGGKSIKATGTYNAVVKSLKEAGVEFVELGGVQPNPRLSLVHKGIELCRKENVDFILAVGGGSVIDSAKAIGMGVYYDGDVWDFYSTEKRPERTLPIGTVLTIPAAGSESSNGSVITNEELCDKRDCCSDILYPVFSILNPELCYTLPKKQILAGGTDILAHVMERYFVPNDNTDLSDGLCEETMKSLIMHLPKVVKNTNDYDAWAELMWTGNVAHNGLIGKGREEDWASHAIEHEISAVYDIAHGAGLAIVFPAWMKYVYKQKPKRFVQFAEKVWGIQTDGMSEDEVCLSGIATLEKFFNNLGLETHLQNIGIDSSHFEEIAAKACRRGKPGSLKSLDENDIIKILNLAL